MDSDHCRVSPADLQSAAFDHSATCPYWWDLTELNRGRADLQSAALPTELKSHMAELVGFGPTHGFPSPGFQDRSLQPLEYSSIFGAQGGN